MTEAKILADSISVDGVRLTSFQVRGPRMILPQLSKHRALSISCRSSRAVPVEKLIGEAVDDPVIPRFGKNQRGMVADHDLGPAEAEAARRAWLLARDDAVDHAVHLARIGAAKEVVNRLIEPFGWFDAVISATDYMNFYALRIGQDSQYEIRELARVMAIAARDSRPCLLASAGDYHLPYVDYEEWHKHAVADLIRISAARCARVSYVPHDSTSRDVAKDLDRANLLEREGHWVPYEHQARPIHAEGRSGNFRGWAQARQGLPLNVHATFDFARLEVSP